MFADLRPIDIFAAARRLGGVAHRTRLHRSEALSAHTGAEVWLKREDEQRTGSFKLRGAFNAIAAMPEDERARGVVASSAGNHGLAVAFAARHFGISAQLFLPSTAPAVKKNGILALGARVDDREPHYDAAMVAARRFSGEHGQRFINPCLGDTLLAGQGTVALEIVAELPALATIIVPVGGGGLAGGIAAFLRHVAPHVRIAGAQSEHTSAMARSLRAGHVVEGPQEPTLADGLAGQIDDEGLDIGRQALDDLVLLGEDEIASAIAWLARDEEAIVEGSGAVAVAALLQRRIRDLSGPAVVVVSGKNIDAATHRGIVERYAK